MFYRKERSRLRRLFFFYPGGLLTKRFLHLLVIYSISINLYIGYIQDELYFESRCLIEEAEETVTQFKAVAEAGVNTLRSIENMLYWSDIDWWTYADVRLEGNKTAKKVKAQKRVIDTYSEKLKEYGSVYAAMSTLLKILTWLFWIRVGVSLVWIIGDLMFGGARTAMFFFLSLSAVSNTLLFNYLLDTYPLAVLPRTLVKGFFATMDVLEGLLNTLFSSL